MVAGRTNSPRNRLLGLIHLAVKDLGMEDDDYREVLRRETGKQSAGQCSPPEMYRVIAAFERLGWKGSGRGSARRASHPIARKARAMWIGLHALGAIDNPSERALEHFGKRQLGVDKLQWADQSHSGPLIEALKVMAERSGWSQRLPPRMTSEERGRMLSERLVSLLQTRLVETGSSIAAIDPASLDSGALNAAIVELGAQLRDAGATGRD